MWKKLLIGLGIAAAVGLVLVLVPLAQRGDETGCCCEDEEEGSSEDARTA